MTMASDLRRGISPPLGRRTFNTRSALSASSAETSCAPADWYSASGNPAFAPAPYSTETSAPSPTNFLTVSGVAATRVSAGSVSAGTPISMKLPPTPSTCGATSVCSECPRAAAADRCCRDRLRSSAFEPQRVWEGGKGAKSRDGAKGSPSRNCRRARPRCIDDAAASGPRYGFGQAIVGFVSHLERLEFEELALGFLLRGLGLLDLTQKLGDRALEVVAPNRRRSGVARIGEVGGVGDAGALLFIGDLTIEVADHAGKLGQHHLDLPNTAALLLKLKALQTDKRVPRLHFGRLLSNSNARGRRDPLATPTRQPDDA